jgi:hypothetical protein
VLFVVVLFVFEATERGLPVGGEDFAVLAVETLTYLGYVNGGGRPAIGVLRTFAHGPV